jgi:hypothetical protein
MPNALTGCSLQGIGFGYPLRNHLCLDDRSQEAPEPLPPVDSGTSEDPTEQFTRLGSRSVVHRDPCDDVHIEIVQSSWKSFHTLLRNSPTKKTTRHF